MVLKMENNRSRNREDILRQNEVRAKADLADLGAQGKGFGTGFAEGAVERQKVLQEEEFTPYEGTIGNKRGTNIGFLIILAIFGLVIAGSLISRFI